MTVIPCPQRGRLIGDDQCFCRHPEITGSQRKSTPVLLTQCETCPIPHGGKLARPKLWGDIVASGLAFVGITKQRVERVTGKPCRCGQRQAKLNRLHRWCKEFLTR